MQMARDISDDYTFEVRKILHDFCIFSNCRGYKQTYVAVNMAIRDPESLVLISKRLYRDVAKDQDTEGNCVERNIRTVSRAAWKNNRGLLEELAGGPLTRAPTAAQFISILVAYVTKEKMEQK